MKDKKTLKKKEYVTPEIDVIFFELEKSILQASGTGEAQQLKDFGWEDW